MLKKRFAIALLTATFACYATALTVVTQGRSDYVITYPDDAVQGVKQAAMDLQTYVRKATGAQLPIVKAGQVDKRSAFRLGFLKEATVPDSFVVRVQGKDIHISGKDSPGNPCRVHWADTAWMGTWFGVCDFLEKQLDIRWFFPGELGEYVPHTTGLTIPDDLSYTEVPAMEMRRMGYTVNYYRKNDPKELKERELWLRRNRHGMAESWCAWHSWLHHMKGSDYFKDHPQWFALVNGRRYGTDSGYGLKMCTTNSEALDQFAKNLIAYRKQTKQPIMLTLSPNDSGNFCECDACRALDNGTRPDGTPIMTDRILTYANEVAKRVKQVLPNQKFGLYAYGYYAECAGTVKVDPAITIMTVDNGTGISYYDPQHRADHLKDLKAWKKRVGKLYFYSHPEGIGHLNMPCSQFHNILMLYQNLYKAGITGYDMNNSSSFGASGLNHYFYLKCAWKLPRNPEAMYANDILRCYGPIAAPTVRSFFDETEKLYSDYANSKQTKIDRAMGASYNTAETIIGKIMTGFAEAWLPKLKMACQMTTDPGQKARLKLLIDNLEYTQTTTALYRASTQVRNSAKPTVQQILRADNLAARRERQLQAMQKLPNNVNVQGIRSQEQNYRLPFDRKVFAFMLSSQTRKQAVAVRRQGLPTVDGKLDEDFWSKVPAMRINLNKDTGDVFPVGADAKIAVTQQALHLAVRSEEPHMELLKDSATTPHAEVWNENYVDIFIDPSARGTTYYQLCINTLGTCRMFKITDGISQEITLKPTIATARFNDHWTLEVSIPLDALTAKADCRGDVWHLNICRVRRTVTPNEYACWSSTLGDFKNPARFGALIIH